MGAYFQGGLTFKLTFPSDVYLWGSYFQIRVAIIQLDNKESLTRI